MTGCRVCDDERLAGRSQSQATLMVGKGLSAKKGGEFQHAALPVNLEIAKVLMTEPSALQLQRWGGVCELIASEVEMCLM